MFLDDNLKYIDEELVLYSDSNIEGFSVVVHGLSQAIVNYNHNVVLLAIRTNEYEKLRLLTFNGETIIDIKIPEKHKIWYMSSVKLQIALNGLSEETADKFGRNDWWYDIDLEQGILIKSSLAY